MFLIYVSNFADRQVVAILAQSIKRDLNLSDWQLGLLTGPAMAGFYAVLGLPMAYLADRVHRVRFLAICLVLWSALTASGALARNLFQLALTRVGVSAAESGGTPICASLLADYFPPTRRGTALGIYSAGTAVGILVGFALGGWVNDLAGWRGALIGAGLPGAALAILLLLTVREPVRGRLDPPRDPQSAGPRARSFFGGIRLLWSIRQYRRMLIAAAGPNVTVFVLLSWAPAFAMRSFHVSAGHVGPWIGLGFAVLGASAIVLGGVVCDHFNKRNPAAAIQVTGVVQMLVAPLLLIALFVHNFWVFVAMASLAYGMAAFYSAPNWAVTQSYTPPEMRASSAALMILVYSGFGLGVGPPLVGAVSDLLAGRFGADSLRFALLIPAGFSLVAGVLFFWMARALPHDASIGAQP
jgi:MFS family permease